jgi:hypothetical protein
MVGCLEHAQANCVWKGGVEQKSQHAALAGKFCRKPFSHGIGLSYEHCDLGIDKPAQ